jgi:Xaa-Pro aminopeptidase
MCLDVATSVFGADEAMPLSEGNLRACLEQRLARSTAQGVLFMDRDRPCAELSYALRHVIADPAPRRQEGWGTADIVGNASKGVSRCLRVQSIRPLLHQLRWRKSPGEIAAMRRSVSAGAAAVHACIAATEPGIGEHALSALYEFHVKAKGGAAALAFPPVVGSGANACTIHYRHADSMLHDGEVVLMDAGAEVGSHWLCAGSA